MSHSILITGASGYLGGSLLAQFRNANLPSYHKLYALVRSEAQAEAVEQYGAEPLILDLTDHDSVSKSIIDAKITIIYFLVDSVNSDSQVSMIKALYEVRKQTGQEVHFLHTTGAKIFSQHVGFPTNRSISDADPSLYELQNRSSPPNDRMAKPLHTNKVVIDTAESNGVRSYVFIPCIVYGEGEGFGNRTSIQTVAVVQAAKGVGAVYDVNEDGAVWPVCHIKDNTAVYMELLRKILLGASPDYGKNGYYLASSGSVAWFDIYTAMAKSLAKVKAVKDELVIKADETTLEKMAQTLRCPKEFVIVQIGGICTLKADHASSLGWKAKYPPEHILEAAHSEVELILSTFKD